MAAFFILLLTFAVLGLWMHTQALSGRLEALRGEVAKLKRQSRSSSSTQLRAVEPERTAPEVGVADPEPPAQIQAEAPPQESPEGPTEAPVRKLVKASEPAIDWERWVGIRGAAVVGGIALVLAGLFFVQVAIERGWLGPAARDTLALTVGAIALAAHLPLRQRGLAALADSLAGAGSVLMYGGAWAAARLHDLVPPTIALVVMAATTGTALLLAMRSNSRLLASFALIGGFATPLLLGTLHRDSTATLFGYALVLDLVLIAMARTRRWRMVLPAALVGTLVLHLAWGEVNRADPAPPWLAGALLAGTAVLFTFAHRSSSDRRAQSLSRPAIELLQLIALGTPFALFARHSVFPFDAQASLWPAAGFCGVLVCAAAAATRHFQSALYLGMVGIFSALTLGWFQWLETGPIPNRGSELYQEAYLRWSHATLLLVAILGVSAHWTRLRRARAGSLGFALVSMAAGTVGALRTFASPSDEPYFATLGLLVLAGCHGATYRRGSSLPGAVVGLTAAVCIVAYHWMSGQATLTSMSPTAVLCAPIATFALLLAAHGIRLLGRGRALASAMSAASTILGLAAFPVALASLTSRMPWEEHSLRLIVGGLGAAALALTLAFPVIEARSKVNARIRHFVLLAGLILAAPMLFYELARTGARQDFESSWVSMVQAAMLLGALPAAAAVRLWTEPPIGAGTRIVANLAAASLLLLLVQATPVALWLGSGDMEQALQWRHFVLLAGAAFLAALGFFVDRRDRLAGLGFLAVAATLASSSLTRAVSAHLIVSTAALGFAAAALFGRRARAWKLVRLAGLLGLLPVASLLTQTFLFRGFLATESLVPVQLSIDFGLTLLGALGVAYAIRRAPSTDSGLSGGFTAALRVLSVVAILALLFGWMNAVVLNRYVEPGMPLHLATERMQARDLALSASWAFFGGALLVVGMVRRSAGLRWTSLLVFIACILKVFIHDLGTMTGLSRVASFLGLAVALMAVSLLYARVLGTSLRTRR